jgi:hypothetical protein
MDLIKVETKLRAGEYADDSNLFADDVRLIAANAQLFNRAPHPINALAQVCGGRTGREGGMGREGPLPESACLLYAPGIRAHV